MVGICLGMQLFMDSSDEFSFSSGLGFIKGKVRRLPPQERYRRPNIGWNEVFCREDDDYCGLHKITDSRDFYFAHSYVCDVEKESNVLGYFDYGSARIPAVISNNQNLIGLQFHPEISGPNGIRLLSHIINNI